MYRILKIFWFTPYLKPYFDHLHEWMIIIFLYYMYICHLTNHDTHHCVIRQEKPYKIHYVEYFPVCFCFNVHCSIRKRMKVIDCVVSIYWTLFQVFHFHLLKYSQGVKNIKKKEWCTLFVNIIYICFPVSNIYRSHNIYFNPYTLPEFRIPMGSNYAPVIFFMFQYCYELQRMTKINTDYWCLYLL